ncbi:hypothetical protein Hdeb2414_s1246g00995401 [Helianthus debilis subsp. tardiflorus]
MDRDHKIHGDMHPSRCHGTDLRGCPQSPLVPEGRELREVQLAWPDAVNKVRQKMIEQIDLWLSQCLASNRFSS